MLRIVCLIRSDPPFVYFVNRISEDHKISLVVLESVPFRKRLAKKIHSEGISGLTEAWRSRLSRVIHRKKYLSNYDHLFRDQWKTINRDIPVMEADDINSEAVYQQLKREEPDLILDHGTSIVKDHILETSALAPNLHRGLSPYYRGTYCTERALINWDPYNIGVTIHKMSRIIDGGSILAQKRPIIENGDTVHSIDCRLTKVGTELVIEGIRKLKSGEELQFKKQDVSLGFLTLNKHWTKYLRKQIQYIERNDLIERMLRRPARKQRLPIIEFEATNSRDKHLCSPHTGRASS